MTNDNKTDGPRRMNLEEIRASLEAKGYVFGPVNAPNPRDFLDDGHLMPRRDYGTIDDASSIMKCEQRTTSYLNINYNLMVS